ncbi:DUF4328 domain-containing protein [Saccharomonospora glauca]|uniref:DUF4328 domain-containing protein n=1 Tax=Saccharomonospora glauca TaxID=40990 RepID=UPI0005951A90|nr:DUF4328 domain-containing protein [Saccharomonospora glauca]
MRWVALVPEGARAGRGDGRRRRGPYLGPPSYDVMPRWGFPHVVWRWPTAVQGTSAATPVPSQRLLLIARNAVAVLWTLAALATVAAGAEIWRYVLLVLSRDRALSPAVVGASDALVLTFSLLTFVMTVFAFAAAAWWLLVARKAAADESGQRPPRQTWQVLFGLLVPGPNLAMAGSILAELEHAAIRRPANRRPTPSRLVLAWWVAWVANALLLTLTVVWRARDGVQAQVDAVLLTAFTDLSAVLLAVLTVLVVRRFTKLLAPMDEQLVRPLRVLRVENAPEPPRRPRPRTAAR